jgi:ethanolamine-phosphate cytidylyltransferase
MSFSNNREPKFSDRVIYVDGSFDMFHNGHVELLRKAKERGDFLYVGIHDDDVVNSYMGNNSPILSLHERVLTVLANKYVDDVVIGAPSILTEELIKNFNIQVVV